MKTPKLVVNKPVKGTNVKSNDTKKKPAQGAKSLKESSKKSNKKAKNGKSLKGPRKTEDKSEPKDLKKSKRAKAKNKESSGKAGKESSGKSDKESSEKADKESSGKADKESSGKSKKAKKTHEGIEGESNGNEGATTIAPPTPAVEDNTDAANVHQNETPGNDSGNSELERGKIVPNTKQSDESEYYEAKEAAENESEDELETTRPTINQMKKPNRKLRPLAKTEIVTAKEYEQLNDELTELHTSVQTLKHSYGSIMSSLIALQRRRPKKNRKKAQQKFGLISTPSTTDLNLVEMTKQQADEVNPFEISYFLNPLTRDETFKMLFNEIEKLENSTDRFRTCFDSRGIFLKTKFSNYCRTVNRTVYNLWTFQAYRLIRIVDEIIRNYNDDLLNLFRL